MTWLEIVDPGATTTLQDGGRVGLARFGVPRSGPVDPLSHRLAALLSGAPVASVDGVVAVEVGPHPVRLAVRGSAATLAVAGAGASVVIDGSSLPAPCVVRLEPDETCTVLARTWAYVVPAGELEVPVVLGSRSQHPRSGLGPSLAAGDRVRLTGLRDPRPGLHPPPASLDGPVHVLPAPQTSLFSDAARAALVEATWRTTAAVDRMGARLEGPQLDAPAGHDIVSDGIVAGAIQVPGDGRPFVLTADHQTTGGYPKVAVVAAADLARLVRLPPGSDVRFAWTDVPTARARLQSAHEAVAASAAATPRPHGHALGRANLIGGVVGPTREEP